MTQSISVVINTFNEEKSISKAIKSVSWADEIIVCDMHSEDNTVQVAKKLGAKIIFHKRVNFVEPARNFAISKTSHPWILILDSDEEISKGLTKRLKEMLSKPIVSDFVEIPRKNIIFNKWIKAASWWPDYQIRFFKKDAVVWNDQIHSRPETHGIGLTLPAEEDLTILHNNYQSISQFIDRLNRYTSIEAMQLKDQGYVFEWTDLIQKPFNEFLSRFFANQGYKEGLHGLALSFLQAFSFLIVYLKLWESLKFNEQELKIKDIEAEHTKSVKQLDYWLKQIKGQNSFFKKFMKKVADK